MKSKVVVDGRERTFVLILDQAEEAFQTLSKFADRENITGGVGDGNRRLRASKGRLV